MPRPGPSSSSGCPGQRYQAEINDLENLGEMGSGTCGQVWKMRFRKTGHVIAVKVSPAPREPRPESQPPLLPTCVLRLPWSSVQQMRRSGNKEENKRILMDLDVVLKSHDCPYIVQCFGTFITNVSAGRQPRTPCLPGSAAFLLPGRSPRGVGGSWGVQPCPSLPVLRPQTDVFIAMELMGTCAEKLKKRVQGPIPERILGKMTVAVSGPGRGAAGRVLPPPFPHPPICSVSVLPSPVLSRCPRCRS